MSVSESIKAEGAYIKQSWLVLVLALAFGMALVGVQLWLGPKIEENKLNETLGQVPILVEGAAASAPIEITGGRLFPALDRNGKVIGWVVPAGDQGFADRIEILLGLDRSLEAITGIHVLDQKETPGLGNKIVEEKWRRQFRGKATHQPLQVIKQGTPSDLGVLAISGATISSQSVTDIVNQAVSRMKAQRQTLDREAVRIQNEEVQKGS